MTVKWLLDLVACPQEGCGGRLRASRAGILRCAACGTLYPVLAGAPILVPAPAHWMAAHRDAVLATLVEHDAVEARPIVDAFAAAVRHVEPAPFSDDWVAGAAPRFALPLPRGPVLEDVIDALVGARPGVVLDVGCGDGRIAARIVGRARRLVVADRSLRAVLQARERAAGAVAVVVDAEHLALRPGTIDTLIAANLIDLLDHPAGFFDVARTALRRRGRLVLATPEPGLGDPDDDPAVLLAALAGAGLAPTIVRDPVPWPRVHRRRHAQLDACWVAVAEPT